MDEWYRGWRAAERGRPSRRKRSLDLLLATLAVMFLASIALGPLL